MTRNVNPGCFRKLLHHNEKAGTVFYEKGDCSSGKGIHTSPVMDIVLADITKRFAGAAREHRPMLLAGWSDGSALTRRLSAHPAVLKQANVNPELYEKRVCRRANP